MGGHVNFTVKGLKQYLIEGGHVFTGGSDLIKKEDIDPTMDAYLKEIKRLFPKVWKYWEHPILLGSAGKKDFSGDIDLAIDEKSLVDPEDWNLDKQHITELYALFQKRARTSTPENIMKRAVITAIGEYINNNSEKVVTSDKSAGSGTLFSQFSQIGEDGKPNGKTVQIDCNFGDVDWLKFAYFSDSYTGNIKGLHRTQLMLHMFTHKNHMFKHGNGVFNKVDGEKAASKPGEAIELLNKLYGFHITEKILQNYLSIQEFLKKNLSPMELKQIYDIYLKTLDSTRCDVPEDLQAYWVANQERLKLTGKFLPEDSNLIALKK